MTISQQGIVSPSAAAIIEAAAGGVDYAISLGSNYRPFGPAGEPISLEAGAGDCAISQGGVTTLSVSTDDSVQHRTDSSC